MSKADVIELYATGGSLILSFGAPAWPNHVHFRFRGSTEIDLGNLYIQHYESKFRAWFADRESMNAAGIIGDLSVTCVAMFSPHQYVCYGSLSPNSHVLFIQDAKNSPVRTAALLNLDSEAVIAWRRVMSGKPGVGDRGPK